MSARFIATALAAATWVTGCPVGQTEPRSVEYGKSAPVGQWQVGASAGDIGGAAGTGSTAGAMATAGTGSTAGAMATAGTGSTAGAMATAGTGSSAGAMATAGTGSTAGTGAPAGGQVEFTVTTLPQGGKYAPKNVGAIWITTATGQFVRTLKIWAFIRIEHLHRWQAESAGNQIDAVASATLRNHETHTVTWDYTDANGTPVPDGAYKVVVEVTDYDGAGAATTVDFTKGPLGAPVMPPDQQYFTGMQLVLK